MKLLEGEEMEGRQRDMNEVIGPLEEKLKVEEFRRVIKRLKVRKAAGVDRIPMEAWKYAGTELEEKMINLIKTVW